MFKKQFIKIKKNKVIQKIKSIISKKIETHFKKKILIVGMGRTGSTLLTSYINDIVPEPKIVRHIHYFDQKLLEWADIIVSTKRDFREQMASTQRFLTKLSFEDKEDYSNFNENCFTRTNNGQIPAKYNNITEECEMAMKVQNDWKPYVLHYFELEQFFINPEKYIKDIFLFFKVPHDDKKNKKLILKYKNNPIKENHITKSEKLINYQSLSNEQLNQINIFFNKQYPKIKKDFLYIEKYVNNKND